MIHDKWAVLVIDEAMLGGRERKKTRQNRADERKTRREERNTDRHTP